MTTTPERAPCAASLPTATTSFVGRRRELAETRRLLTAARMLTLTGAGGVGKTRLALRLAETVCRAFPDGVRLVELEALTEPELLAQTVATAVGLLDESANAVDQLTEFLADKRFLLVLDNCEHLPDAAAELARDLLAATAHVKIVATSRHRLGVPGEQLMAVPPLSVPSPAEHGGRDGRGETDGYEALALFAARAAASMPGFTVNEQNQGTVTEICRRLDGMPLAIELAATWLRTLSVEQVLHRLDDRFGLLTRGSPAVLPRQRTLRAAVDWSFDLCSAAERSLWGRLSVFSGGFHLAAAEEVGCGPDLPSAAVLDAVASLVDKSIVLRDRKLSGGQSRYRMLETIQAYGRARLVDSGEERAALERHREYFRSLMQRFGSQGFGPRQQQWLVLLHGEHANLRGALGFCLAEPPDAGHVESALELAGHPHYWFSGGYLREGAGWLDRALAATEAPCPARAHALYARAFLGILLGEHEVPWRLIAECRELAEQIGETAYFLPRIAEVDGLNALTEGDMDRARVLGERALDGLLATGQLQQAFDCLFQLAMGAVSLNDPSAGELSERCLAFCDEHGAQWSKSYALWVLGAHTWQRGDPRRAIGLLRESIRLREAVDDRTGLTFCVEVIAWCMASLGRWHLAARLLGAASAVWRFTGANPSARSSVFRFGHQQVKAEVREKLGPHAYAQAHQEGMASTVEQALALALADEEDQADEEEWTGARVSRGEVASAELDLLTRREREIAGLIAKGLTNKEIAAALVISQRTAESHVENILTKLGFTSRTQIASWIVRGQSRAD